MGSQELKKPVSALKTDQRMAIMAKTQRTPNRSMI